MANRNERHYPSQGTGHRSPPTKNPGSWQAVQEAFLSWQPM